MPLAAGTSPAPTTVATGKRTCQHHSQASSALPNLGAVGSVTFSPPPHQASLQAGKPAPLPMHTAVGRREGTQPVSQDSLHSVLSLPQPSTQDLHIPGRSYACSKALTSGTHTTAHRLSSAPAAFCIPSGPPVQLLAAWNMTMRPFPLIRSPRKVKDASF